MAVDRNPGDPRSFWQGQEQERTPIMIGEIRERAAGFERRIRSRNLREYVACVLVIAFFLFQAFHTPGWRVVRPLLYATGGAVVMFELRRRGGVRPIPPESETGEFLQRHIAELERQRDALRKVWLWYLLPLVPGFVAESVIRAVDSGFGARSTGGLLVLGLALGLIVYFNFRAAGRIDSRIRELRGME